MSGEFLAVEKTKNPNTMNSLIKGIKNLGLKEGSLILLHSSLSSLGWTVGGAVTVIKAFQKALTKKGTLVMPSFTSGNSEPRFWKNPPVPKDWWPVIRENRPAFHPKYTPTRGIGRIPEVFRSFPKVYRSKHPMSSFTAWGRFAREITSNHLLQSDLGEGSPLSRIYDLNGEIILLGVSHTSNTSLHLAEYRSNYTSKSYYQEGSAMFIKNERKWVEWESLDHDSEDFEKIGKAYEEKISFKPKKIGLAISRLLSQPQMVDFAVRWMEKNRN